MSRGWGRSRGQGNWQYLRSLGYKSLVFQAKWHGGTCGLSGFPIRKGSDVAYYKDYGLCITTFIDCHILDGDQGVERHRQSVIRYHQGCIGPRWLREWLDQQKGGRTG